MRSSLAGSPKHTPARIILPWIPLSLPPAPRQNPQRTRRAPAGYSCQLIPSDPRLCSYPRHSQTLRRRARRREPPECTHQAPIQSYVPWPPSHAPPRPKTPLRGSAPPCGSLAQGTTHLAGSDCAACSLRALAPPSGRSPAHQHHLTASLPEGTACGLIRLEAAARPAGTTHQHTPRHLRIRRNNRASPRRTTRQYRPPVLVLDNVRAR
jgi:hypothetical protein